ncbi:DUF1642 domain-containing protein [Listeria seeligeri]|uniref:DUF1642 domain-containing protein n=1 Tax=Listeria seeligeri TaxID=1640 RepID=UPI001886EA4D|nr:DUF1642 domain-containing protein [Listeria seeligeri]MBF2563122.1 DUF1642 domain-containing protein [Listeria seeligeri]
MKFKKGDLVEVIWRSELYRGAVTQVVEATDEIVVKLAKKPAIDYLFNQNQVSKVKLVKVPKFVADVLQVQKEKWWWSLSESLNLKVYACTSFVKEYSVDIRIKDWLSLPSNQELFARAWLDGYEVEQEPLYYIKVIDSYFGYINLNLKTGAYTTSTNEEPVGFKTKFTEKEIKKLDGRYWAFKVPVEEVEDEAL